MLIHLEMALTINNAIFLFVRTVLESANTALSFILSDDIKYMTKLVSSMCTDTGATFGITDSYIRNITI